MTKHMIKIPGKLYIAGEYAVVYPGHSAILTAVNRYIKVTIKDNDVNSINIPLDQYAVNWPLNKPFVAPRPAWRFVAEALNTTQTYLQEQNVPLTPVSLNVNSQLASVQGAKFGLGSSAAVTVAVVTALLTQFKQAPSKTLIFKLAAIAHYKIQGNGSCGDIAACTYGGWLSYTSFDQPWLLEQLQTASVSELVAKEWPLFHVLPLKAPTPYFCVGWTGSPAGTKGLVSLIQTYLAHSPQALKHFLTTSDACVDKFAQGIIENNTTLLKEALLTNRRLLKALGKKADVPIETPLLTTLCDLSFQVGGFGKTSGSGGGDCGIAFVPTAEMCKKLYKRWLAAGIKPLDFKEGRVSIEVIED